MVKKKCIICGKEVGSLDKYCSVKCFDKGNNQKIKLKNFIKK